MVIRDFDLVFFWTFLKRNIFVMLISGALLGCFAFCVSKFLMPKRYSSTASVFVGRVDSDKAYRGDTSSLNSLIYRELIIGSQLMEDYQELLSRKRIAEKVENIFTETEGRKIPAYSMGVAAKKKARFLDITITTISPEDAQKIAEIITSVFVNETRELLGISNVKVVDNPKLMKKPVSPRIPRNTVIGFLLGAMGAAGIIFILTICDTKIYSPDELKVIFEPVIGVLPRDTELVKRHDSGDTFDQIVTLRSTGEDKHNMTESFRSLRNNLQYIDSKHNDDGKVFAFTSSTPGEGKTFTSANIAVSLAEAGYKTVIINCDLHKPALSNALGVTSTQGIVNVLVGEATINDVTIRNIRELSLDVILCGPIPPNPSRLLLSDEFAQIIADLRKEYEYIKTRTEN